MWVYIGTSGELKNAYIGEVIEYEWDFTDWTNTIASLQSQWWNFNGKNVSVSSSWFYHEDGRTKFSPFSLSTVKRTEIELTFNWDSNDSNSSIWYWELSGSTHGASGLWIPTYYGSKWYWVALLGTQYKEVVNITAPWQYSWKVIIDLESWELSCSLSWYWTKSTTMNSTQINDIKQASWIMMYNLKTYIKYLKITFSM